jgi:putative sigma-54 modulation protein
MQIEIQGKDIPITDQLRGHIQRRLSFALERFATQIIKVRVSVGDLNGPRGGVDKRCRVAIALILSKTIVIEERDSSLYVAVDRVGDRAGTCIGRRLERGRNRGQDARISELLF